jgi:hypothetical protein
LTAWLADAEATPVRATVKCAREPVYLAFRYRKLGRRTPQSMWVVDGRVKGVGSIEEYVCGAANDVADCDAAKLAASGREDWDVRMLGRGRPAYVELQNCRRWAVRDVVAEFTKSVVARSSGVVEVLRVAESELKFPLLDGVEACDRSSSSSHRSRTQVRRNRGQSQGGRRQRFCGDQGEDVLVRHLVRKRPVGQRRGARLHKRAADGSSEDARARHALAVAGHARQAGAAAEARVG